MHDPDCPKCHGTGSYIENDTILSTVVTSELLDIAAPIVPMPKTVYCYCTAPSK